jgi:hypothetical protein
MHFEYIEEQLPDVPILYLNASSLKVTACRRHYGMMVNGYQGVDGDTTQRDIGSAMHKFAELFTRTGDHAESVLRASQAWPQVSRQVIIAAAARRQDVVLPPPIILEGEPLVEIKFSIPWFLVTEATQPVCQIILCGTMDHLGYDGAVRLIDYKSTAYAIVKYALDKYKHETQFMFYMAVLRKFGHRMLPLHLHNLIVEGKFSSQVCIIQTSAKEPRWSLGPKSYMTEDQYNLYFQMLEDLLPTLVRSFRDSSFATPDGMLRNACQYCGYKSYCYAKDSHEAGLALASFKIEPYNPIKERTS